MKRNCTICVAKTKTLISCAVTVQQICIFVLAYAKIRFSHEVVYMKDFFIWEKNKCFNFNMITLVGNCNPGLPHEVRFFKKENVILLL